MLKGGGDTVLAFDLRFESAVQDRCRTSHNLFRQYCLNPWIGQGQFRPSARTKSVAFKLFQPCGNEVWRFEVLDSQGSGFIRWVSCVSRAVGNRCMLNNQIGW